MIQIVHCVQLTVVIFDFRIHVITAARRVIPSLMNPIAGFIVVINIDGDGQVITAGYLAVATLLCTPDLAARPRV
jgi:hypothetical protein